MIQSLSNKSIYLTEKKKANKKEWLLGGRTSPRLAGFRTAKSPRSGASVLTRALNFTTSHIELSIPVHLAKSITTVYNCFVKGQYLGQRDESFLAHIPANCEQSAPESHQNPSNPPRAVQRVTLVMLLFKNPPIREAKLQRDTKEQVSCPRTLPLTSLELLTGLFLRAGGL